MHKFVVLCLLHAKFSSMLNTFLSISICLRPTGTFEINDQQMYRDVVENGMLILSCEVTANKSDGNKNWKSCEWSRSSAFETCRYKYMKYEDGNGMQSWDNKRVSCDSTFRNPVFEGSERLGTGKINHLCRIHITSAQLSDSGTWTCTLEQCLRGAEGGCKCGQGSGKVAQATRTVQVIK